VASAVVTCGAFTLYVLVRRRRVLTLVNLGIAVAAVTWLLVHYGGAMDIVTKRLAGEGGQWTKMARGLDMGTLLSSIPFFLVGHAAAYGNGIAETEIAHVKILSQLGILHTTVLYSVLLYPVVLFVRVRRSCAGALPAVAVICFGVLSLTHYGSLMRSTNVFLFYAVYSVCLRQVFGCGESSRLAAAKTGVAPKVFNVQENGAAAP
jgi:hydrogenase maturation factor